MQREEVTDSDFELLVIMSLVERGLLEEAGRPSDGGAMRYRTTRAFQERFGLRRAGDLPPLERFELSGPEAAARPGRAPRGGRRRAGRGGRRPGRAGWRMSA